MERERGFRNMRLRAPSFSGSKSQNVKVFFSSFEKYIQHQEIDQQDHVNALGLCLEGIALSAYDSFLRNNEDADYDDIKEALLARFDDNSIEIVTRSKLGNRKLKPGESISDYYTEVRTYADQIEITDQELLYIFISGLNLDMQKHLVCQNPDSCEAAVAQAKALQQVSKLSQPSSAIEQLKNELKETQVSALSNEQNPGFQDTMLDFMKETVNTLKGVQERLHHNENTQNDFKQKVRFQNSNEGANQKQFKGL